MAYGSIQDLVRYGPPQSEHFQRQTYKVPGTDIPATGNLHDWTMEKFWTDPAAVQRQYDLLQSVSKAAALAGHGDPAKYASMEALYPNRTLMPQGDERRYPGGMGYDYGIPRADQTIMSTGRTGSNLDAAEQYRGYMDPSGSILPGKYPRLSAGVTGPTPQPYVGQFDYSPQWVRDAYQESNMMPGFDWGSIPPAPPGPHYTGGLIPPGGQQTPSTPQAQVRSAGASTFAPAARTASRRNGGTQNRRSTKPGTYGALKANVWGSK